MTKPNNERLEYLTRLSLDDALSDKQIDEYEALIGRVMVWSLMTRDELQQELLRRVRRDEDPRIG